MNQTAVLSIDNRKDCFIGLSEDVSRYIGTTKDSVFEISSTDSTVYATSSGEACQGHGVVKINGLFADKQRLKNNDMVLLRQLRDVPACLRVYVEPMSIDDWEILELHAGFIESNLLNQIRVVWSGQVFPVWVQKSVCIFVKTGDVEPISQCALLEERTEVIITPKDRRSEAHQALANSTQSLSQNTSTNMMEQSYSSHSVSEEPTKKPTNDPPVKRTRFADDLSRYRRRASDQNYDIQPDGILSSAWNYVSSWWSDDSNQSDEKSLESKVLHFLEGQWKASLRVQQFGTFLDIEQIRKKENSFVEIEPIDLVQQPSNVYIGRSTFESGFKFAAQKCESSTFLAYLTCLPSPSQKEQILKRKMEKSSLKSTDTNPLATSGENGSCDHESDITKTKNVVRVIVLDDDKVYRLLGDNELELGRAQMSGYYGVLNGHVMISDQLRRQLALDVTGRVVLTSLSRNTSQPCEPDKLTLHPLFENPAGFTNEMLITALKSWIVECCDVLLPLVVNVGTLVTVPLKPDFEGEFLISFLTDDNSTKSSTTKYTLLHRHLVDKMKVVVEEQLTASNRPTWLTRLPCLSTSQLDPELPNISLDQLGGIEDVANIASRHIELSLCQRLLSKHFCGAHPGVESGGVLVCGGRGVGRTSLAKALCRHMTQPPNYASCTLVECKHLRGKRVESILKTLERVFSDAAWRQPSVIVLDDLDVICGSPSGPEEEMSGDAIYFSRAAQVVRDLLKAEMREHSLISVIATCQDPSSIHESLTAPQGLHFFQQVVEIKPPNKVQRQEIMHKLLQRHRQIDDVSSSSLNMTSLVAQTEGFVVRDLEQVLQRAVHTHTILNPDIKTDVIQLTESDFDIALNGFTPASLKNVNLHDPSDVGWSDVGGLHTVRHLLVETLQWPAKYPELFDNCPLRLRSGLLLYGAPGTGKTLLASVVAKECGLNFISIKGPELLSKYIGASEQAVRDTFLRAQSAKPCILFFDEFDSLAPRRGHDSTGVTDRVVNQLLTQLDGVEALEGVYVLAATSRPDLIDPALLRPGRLDKALLCPIPTEEERCEILTSLTRHMSLADDVSLTDLAQSCDHFTGADFKALLYNAQLITIHELYGIDIGGGDSRLEEIRTGNAEEFPSVEGNSLVVSEGDVTKRNKSSDSENSATSTSSWEAVGVPLNESSELVVVEHPHKSVPSFTYIANLEDGVTEISDDLEQSLSEQVSSVLLLPESTESVQESSHNAAVIIHQSHFHAALKNMGPSVSRAERAKFDSIYNNFVSSRGSNLTEMPPTIGKRATLA